MASSRARRQTPPERIQVARRRNEELIGSGMSRRVAWIQPQQPENVAGDQNDEA